MRGLKILAVLVISVALFSGGKVSADTDSAPYGRNAADAPYGRNAANVPYGGYSADALYGRFHGALNYDMRSSVGKYDRWTAMFSCGSSGDCALAQASCGGLLAANIHYIGQVTAMIYCGPNPCDKQKCYSFATMTPFAACEQGYCILEWNQGQ